MGDDGTMETRITTVARIVTHPAIAVSTLTHVPKRHTVNRTLKPAAIFLRPKCAVSHRRQPGNMPQAEAGRGPIVCAFGMCGPSSLHSGLTDRIGCPFTHKPGALEAGEAAEPKQEGPNCPSVWSTSRIPDKTFIAVRLPCPPAGLPKGRAKGSACAMPKQIWEVSCN